MDDPRESRKEEKPSTREGMIDEIHYRETRAIRPHPFPPSLPPPSNPNLFFFFLVHTRSQSCLFLFLRYLSACSTLMHLLAYRYNCRAIIKAGLSFFLSLFLLPLPSLCPRCSILFPLLPSCRLSLPLPCILPLPLPPSDLIANAFRSRSTCVPVAFSSRSPTPCTDFQGKSRTAHFSPLLLASHKHFFFFILYRGITY